MASDEGTDAGPEGPFRFLSRRRFLKTGLAGGSVLLAGGGGLLALRGCAADVEGLRTLDKYHYRVLAAVARAHIPRGGPFELGADDADMARLFDGFLVDEPAANIRDLKMALTLIEYGPLIFERRLSTFSRLTPDEQLAHWESWINSPRLLQRQASTAFRKFISLVFYDRETVWSHIGYGGPDL